MIGWAKEHRWHVIVAAVLTLAIGGAVWHEQSAAPEVEVVEAARGDVVLRIAASGLVETNSTDLAFKGQGKIAALYCQEGESVTGGQVLARLDANLEAGGGRPATTGDVLTAPSDGSVVELYLRPGAVVAPGVPVLRFAPAGEAWVTAFLDCEQAATVRPGQRFQCRAGGYLSQAYELAVEAVGREAVPRRDLPGSARQVRVRCRPTGALPLAAGAEVDIDGDVVLTRDALVIPAAAIVHEGPSDWVWVVDGRTVHRRQVALGPNNFENVAIRDGLTVGERVVVHGKDELKDGQTVNATPAD